MKNGTLLRPIVLLSILSASAAGWGKWGIATSCSIQQKELVWNEMNIVRASVKSMADGLTAQPAPSTVTQLYVQWMFGLAQPDYDPIIFPKAVFGGSASIFGLNNFGAQPQTIENMGVGDVLDFCGMGHIYPPNEALGETQWYDSFHELYYDDPKGTLNSCFLGVPDNEGNPPVNAFRARSKPGQMQSVVFCSWFMQKAMNARFRDHGRLDMNLYTRQQRWWGDNPRPANFPQIDLFRLFDSTMLHELSHTIPGGSKLDVAEWSSYGWNNARRISTNTDTVNPS